MVTIESSRRWRLFIATIFEIFYLQGKPMSQYRIGDINNNNGIITQGQVGNNVIYNKSPRLEFDKAIGDKIISVLQNRDKKINVEGTGNLTDVKIGSRYADYFKSLGRKVEYSSIDMKVPDPEKKITIIEKPNEYIIVIAPSIP